ncbi:hypothetical protein HOLleu_21896 [Holothuria leucospilota]|uniref:Uncharacterized protein n=1 Tax=Holothuria leucospilota TaxID=206669 RepID=A0A9Q1BX07_HOLLE|nr:hypothetical protein HOLleu_21896 [Holothuria leucospilota]
MFNSFFFVEYKLFIEMAKAEWVTDALPGLSADDVSNVLHQLDELGVEEESDLCMVEEEDLVGILKAIQARKVTAVWKKQTVPVKIVNAEPQSQAIESGNKVSDSSHAVSIVRSPIPPNLSPRSSSWVQSFKIPWEEMPENLIALCESKKRPKPSMRREMVRKIIKAVCQVTETPGKKNLDRIAETVVNKYPASFRDQIDDRVIGSGYASLAKQLLNRFENVHRQPVDSLRKRIYEVSSGGDEDDCPDSGRNDRVDRTDSYGCINWQPSKFPSKESVDTQRSHQLWLQEEHRKVVWDKEEVSKKMQLTYTSQRLTINKGKFSIAEIIEKWPFLSEEDFLLEHFKELVGINLKQELLNSVTTKAPKIFRSVSKTY